MSLFDARPDEMSDAPEETSEGSLGQPLKGAAGYETQLASSTLAPFSLSQVSLPTEGDLGACPDLSNVVPPWCLTYLEGDHERMLRGVDEYERIARDTPVEPYTDPILQRVPLTVLAPHQEIGSAPHALVDPASSRTCWHFLR